MKNFELKGWLAAGVSIAVGVSLLLSVVLFSGGGGIEALGVSNFDTLQVEDGSASSPSLSFTSDTDIGLYRSSANVIGLSVGGSSVGTFSSSGWTGGVSIGSNDLSGRNITATGTLSVAGSVALPNNEIGIAEIANISRTVSISLRAFIECSTDAGADINFTDGADAFPDFINSATDGTGFTLTFDDTGGSIDTAYVCANLAVPADYASGGSFVVRTTKDAETGANTEVVNCAGSINGAALGVAGTVTVATNTTTAYTCTPTLTSLAAGNSLSFELHITSGGTVDDKVNIHSVEFQYLATQ